MSDRKIYSAQIDATGTLVAASPGRLRTIMLESLAVSGPVIFRDGGSGGAILLELDSSALIEQVVIQVPGHIQFKTDLHVTFGATVAGGVTIFYS